MAILLLLKKDKLLPTRAAPPLDEALVNSMLTLLAITQTLTEESLAFRKKTLN
jgi:hypothetical protein